MVAYRPTAYLFSPHEAKEEHLAERRRSPVTPMTPSQRARTRKPDPKKVPGDVYETRSYYHAIRNACPKAGVPNWHPNQLRHNAATWLRKEFGLDVARVILGHSSSAVTEVTPRSIEQGLGHGTSGLKTQSPMITTIVGLLPWERGVPALTARDRLQSCGIEISEWWRSSPTTELRYASLIPIGDRHAAVSSLRSWEMPPSNWEGFPKRKRTSSPIVCGSFRLPRKRHEIAYCFYGNLSIIEWNRFKDWASDATRAAACFLGLGETELVAIPFDYLGWSYLCYRVAWEFPQQVGYTIESDVALDFPLPTTWPHTVEDGEKVYRSTYPGFGSRNFDPFESREAFEAFERGEAVLQDGHHFAYPSGDLRFCSSCAIEAMLAQDESKPTIENNPKLDYEALTRKERDISKPWGDTALVGNAIGGCREGDPPPSQAGKRHRCPRSQESRSCPCRQGRCASRQDSALTLFLLRGFWPPQTIKRRLTAIVHHEFIADRAEAELA